MLYEKCRNSTPFMVLTFTLEAVLVSGREKEGCTGLEDTRDARKCLNLIFGIEMEHDAPSDRSIEGAIDEWAGLHDCLNGRHFRIVESKMTEHRARTVKRDNSVSAAQQCFGEWNAISAPNIENTRSAWQRRS
jgi:hypothetical protein